MNKWTKETPEKPGYYWYRGDGVAAQIVEVNIDTDTGRLWGQNESLFFCVTLDKGPLDEWCFIQQPE